MSRFWFTVVLFFALQIINPICSGQDFGFPAGDGLGQDLGFGLPGLNQEKVTFSAEFKVEQGSGKGELYVTAEVIPQHHIYSLNPIDGGPIPTTLTVDAKSGVTLLGPFKSTTDPEIHLDPGFMKNVEEHRGSVTWKASFQVANPTDLEKLEIPVKCDGQVCKDDASCDQFNTTVTAKFVGYLAPPAKAGEFSPKGIHAKLTGHIQPKVVQAGGVAQLVITVEPQDGYHAYGFAEKPSELPFITPTHIGLLKKNGWPTLAPQASVEPTKKESGFEEAPFLFLHKDPVTWTIDFKVPAGTKDGEYEFEGIIGLNTCTDQTCDRPTGIAFTGKITVGGKADLEKSLLEFRETEGKTGGYKGAQEAAKKTEWSKALDSNAGAESSLLQIIGLSFLAGLILNVMPCVLPVIALKLLSFAQQAKDSRLRVSLLNVTFVAGMMCVFLALATLASVFKMGWGDQFQSVGFTYAMISIVFVFALSLLGVWEIPIPGFSGGAANKLAQKEGFVGAFFKGVLTTLLATPCTGPLLTGVVTYALTQPTYVTYTIFIAIGVGMGSPYLLVIAFPNLVRIMPKPGEWMEHFKKLMGFAMVGTVIWLMNAIPEKEITGTLILLLGFGMAAWIVGLTPIYAELTRKVISWTTGSACAVAAYFIGFVLLAPGVELDWVDFNRSTLEQELASGKTVMVDFTADWCATCKVNERTAFNTVTTKNVIEKLNIVAMKADKTRPNNEITELLKELGNGSAAIPYFVVFPGNGGPPIKQDGPLTVGAVVDMLEKAGASVPQPGAEQQKTVATN